MAKNLYRETGKNEVLCGIGRKWQGGFVCFFRKGPPDVARPTNEEEG